MRPIVSRACLLAVISLLVGCASLYALLGIGEPRFKLDAQVLYGLPVVTREEFAAMLAERHYGTVSPDVRDRAMAILAVLNEPGVHGLDIDLAAQPIANASLLVVARAREAGPPGGSALGTSISPLCPGSTYWWDMAQLSEPSGPTVQMPTSVPHRCESSA